MRAIALLGLLAMAVAMHPSTPAFAEPLEEITASVSNFDGASSPSATVTITWNHDGDVANYRAGCVSCNPNTSESTTDDSIELHGVTPFPNGSSAMLYVVAYDSENEIIAAKQLIVSLDL